ncbi:MAG: 50S ribosomal protein L19 [Armatimonadetes bacterium]|nr:50S ribosomal protein L19 [Armatimonadota bacterium]
MTDLIKHVEALNREALELRPEDIEPFNVGDTLRIEIEVTEGNKTRLQPFQGVCIKRNGGGHAETFTLRRVASGVGVERTFPLLSPKIKSLTVIRRGKVRRARLYYLRTKVGKAGRIKEAAREESGGQG